MKINSLIINKVEIRSVRSLDDIRRLRTKSLPNAKWNDAYGEMKIIPHIVVPYMAYNKAERA